MSDGKGVGGGEGVSAGLLNKLRTIPCSNFCFSRHTIKNVFKTVFFFLVKKNIALSRIGMYVGICLHYERNIVKLKSRDPPPPACASHTTTVALAPAWERLNQNNAFSKNKITLKKGVCAACDCLGTVFTHVWKDWAIPLHFKSIRYVFVSTVQITCDCNSNSCRLRLAPASILLRVFFVLRIPPLSVASSHGAHVATMTHFVESSGSYIRGRLSNTASSVQ